MSVAPYPEYKDSGVEWIGHIPLNWLPARLKDAARLKMGQSPPSEDYINLEDGIPFLQGCAEFGAIHPQPRLACLTAQKFAEPGELLFSVRAPVGRMNIADQRYGIGRGLCAITPHLLNHQFAFWLLDGLRSQLDAEATGSTFEAVSTAQVANMAIAIPSPEEQSAIAAFLDQETGKIDALVAEQERLIALLKEKRQAVISQAVTKGLNPNAPMKDSGIEWLGQVPAHWEPRKVSHLFRAGKGKNGQMLTKEFCAANEGPYPVYSGQTEDDGVMGTWCEFEFDFSENGVLFCTTVGARAMHLKQLHGRFSLSQNCMIVWPTDSRCITRFFFYHFQPLFQWERSLIPDHMQPSFRMEDLYSFSVAVPPVDEQREIFEFLDRETNKIDTLITEATQAITLLRERRAALISAAVTGKIDVRALATSQPEAA